MSLIQQEIEAAEKYLVSLHKDLEDGESDYEYVMTIAGLVKDRIEHLIALEQSGQEDKARRVLSGLFL